ncbi:hypothetical protein BGZ99_006563 [Dissophora globulifera]|uniref:Uncharacterized protein n=1 Tax=Dissophora globulifera TaxID=979702 RepID=A0A9P6URX0_9FUNG|nr:hypothetical protein BGZ99_006563 [Dissophora globulifera]
MREKDLLTKFLVGNELHDSVTLQQFTQSFPTSYQSSPEIKDLYRVYLNARHQVRGKVRRNIEIEVRRNPFHLDQYHEQQFDHVDGNDDQEYSVATSDDMDIEDIDKHLTLDQAIQELTQAENIFLEEIRQLEAECNEFTQEFQNLDRGMDNIRVPREPAHGVNEEALMKDLQNLITLCDTITESVPSDSSSK